MSSTVSRMMVWALLAGALALDPVRAQVQEVSDVVRPMRLDDKEVETYIRERLPAPPLPPLPPSAEHVALAADLITNGTAAEAERAAWVLGDWPSPDGAKPLLNACGHKDAGVRAQAAASLGRMAELIEPGRRSLVVATLVAMTSDDDRRVVVQALRSLGELKAFGNTAVFARYVASQDAGLALEAVLALGRWGRPESFKLFRPALKSGDLRVVVAAIEATAALGDPALAQPLAGQLASPSTAVRVAAVRAMVFLKGTAHLSALAEMARKDPNGSVRREALAALVELGGAQHESDYLAGARDPDGAVRRVGLQAIGRFRLAGGLARAFELFEDKDFYVRQDAVDALVAIGSEQVLSRAAEGLGSQVATVRECSSQVLGRLRSDAGLAAHMALLEDAHLPARRWAAWALGEIGRKEAVEPLRKCAFLKAARIADADPTWAQDEEAGACAIQSLAKLGDGDGIPSTVEVLKDKAGMNHPGAPLLMRMMSARALGLLDGPDAAGLLVERFSDTGGNFPESAAVRLEAAVALGRLRAETAVDLLKQEIGREGSDSRLRIACQWAAARITGVREPLVFKPSRSSPFRYFFRPVDSPDVQAQE